MPSGDGVDHIRNVVQHSQPWQLLTFADAKSHIGPSHLGRISFITRNGNADVVCHYSQNYHILKIMVL